MTVLMLSVLTLTVLLMTALIKGSADVAASPSADVAASICIIRPPTTPTHHPKPEGTAQRSHYTLRVKGSFGRSLPRMLRSQTASLTRTLDAPSVGLSPARASRPYDATRVALLRGGALASFREVVFVFDVFFAVKLVGAESPLSCGHRGFSSLAEADEFVLRLVTIARDQGDGLIVDAFGWFGGYGELRDRVAFGFDWC